MGATRERNWYTSFMRAPSPTMLCSRLISVFSRRFSCSSHCSRRAFSSATAEIPAIHVYAADHFLKHRQGHAQQRMNVRFDNAVHIAETTSAGNIGSEYRNALFENLARNGPAYPHGLS